MHWLLLLLLLLMILRFGACIDQQLRLLLKEVLQVEQLRHDPTKLIAGDWTCDRVVTTRHCYDSSKPDRTNKPRQVKIEGIVFAGKVHFRHNRAASIHGLVNWRPVSWFVSSGGSVSIRMMVGLWCWSGGNVGMKWWRRECCCSRGHNSLSCLALLLLCRENESWFPSVQKESTGRPLGNVIVLNGLWASQDQASAGRLNFRM